MGGSFVCGENGLCSIKTLIMAKKENIESSMDQHKIQCLVEGKDLNNEKIDYYQHSKNVWEYLNNIRENPKKYATVLLSSIKKYEKERSNLKLENDNPDISPMNSSKNNKNDITNINDSSPKKNYNNLLTYMTNYLLNHEDMLTIIKELVLKLERFQPDKQLINNKANDNQVNKNNDMNNNPFSSSIENNEVLCSLPILVNYEAQYQKYKHPREWNKNLYDAIDNAFKKKNDNCSNNEFDEKNGEEFSAQVILSTALQQRVKVIEYEISNYATPEIVVWRLLIANREKICDILYDDYFSGLSYSFIDTEEATNNEKTEDLEFFKTNFYFIYKLNEEDIVINGLNPFSGLYLPLKLTEPIFKDINFKNEIVGGNYVYNENGITAAFELYNGEHKEENIEFHENNLLGF